MKKHQKLLGAGRFLALALFLILALAPLYWIVVTSLKGPKEIYTFPLKYWPARPTLESYRKLFSFSAFGAYFRNSLLVSLSASFGAMILSVAGGFALSRYDSDRSRGKILLGLYFTQTIPTFILMTPSSPPSPSWGWWTGFPPWGWCISAPSSPSQP